MIWQNQASLRITLRYKSYKKAIVGLRLVPQLPQLRKKFFLYFFWGFRSLRFSLDRW